MAVEGRGIGEAPHPPTNAQITCGRHHRLRQRRQSGPGDHPLSVKPRKDRLVHLMLCPSCVEGQALLVDIVQPAPGHFPLALIAWAQIR